jgi:hypothetical protein
VKTKPVAPAREASTGFDQEPIKIPKTSKAWLWVTLLLIVGLGGAWYRWPTEIKQWLAQRGIGGGGGDTPVQIVPVPETTATTSTATAPTDSAKPAVTTPASAASPQPSTHPSASASASHPEPSATHHGWPVGGHEPPVSSASAVPPVAPTSTWSPYKQATPAPTASDNPYSGAPPP